jgi:vacuolar-type H+-ATPase subunit F/Vma7
MGSAAVIGAGSAVLGYAMAGAIVCPVRDEAEALAAWRSLPADVEVVILTPAAARWLGGELAERSATIPVVMPG